MVQIQANMFVAVSAAHQYGCRVPARNDNSRSGSYCPRCKKTAVAPVASKYRGKGLVSHRWHCTACDYDWMTTSRVPY